MPHSESHTKRLLSEMPSDPEDLLRSSSFRDPAFLDLYFEHLDELIFHDPKSALPWARVAPELALLIREVPGTEGRHGALVQAYSVLGSAYRALGDHRAANSTYATALSITRAEDIPPAISADLYQRVALLRSIEHQLAEALVSADEAVRIFQRHAPQKLGESLIIQGYVLYDLGRFSEAAASFSQALAISNPRDSAAAARIHHSAIHNLACVVAESSRDTCDLAAALRHIREARHVLEGQRGSVPRHKLQWLQGLIWAKLDAYALAEQAFSMALRGFRELDLPFEIALVSLDLGALHHRFGEWQKLEAIASRAYKLFWVLASDTEAAAALHQWLTAVTQRELTDAINTRARQAIESRLKAG